MITTTHTTAALLAALALTACGTDEGPAGPIDCATIPTGPFELRRLDGPIASEDLAFDAGGHLVGADDTAIFRTRYGGQAEVFVPAFPFRAGLRYLPDGDLVVADNERGELVRIGPDGVRRPFLTGLGYPNGLAVDAGGLVYFSEHDVDTVWRVDPANGERTFITDAVSSPNGLAFDATFTTLYVGGFNGDPTVWALDIGGDGAPGPARIFARDVGSGWHDGLAVDVCGNVYVTDYTEAQVWRVSPDGADKRVILDASSLPNSYLPNLQWGSGIGGWSRTALYLPDGWTRGVFEVEVGVTGAPLPYP